MEGSSEKSQLVQLWSLFCEVRDNLDEASTIFLKKTIPLGADQSEMLNAQFPGILMWLSKIFSFLIKQKQQLEQIIEKKNASECSDYEQALQKLEAEVRQHIRVQQQMKLYAESTQEKLDQTTKERGLFEEKIKELEKKLVISAQDQQEEITKLKRQIALKVEQADSTEETIRALTKQIHQLQGQSNPIYPQEFTTKPIDKQNYQQQQFLMQAQQNEFSRCVNQDAQKKQIRSISSMNEELSKKYIQLGGQQSLFSTSSHITAPSDNSSKSNAFSEISHLRTYTEPPTQERSNSRQGELMNDNKKYLEKASPNHPERKNQQTRYYSIEAGSKNKLQTNTTSSSQAPAGSNLQNNIQTAYSQAFDQNKEPVGQVIVKQKPFHLANSGLQSQEKTQNNSLISNSQYSKSELSQNPPNKVVNLTTLTSKIKNMNNYQYLQGNSSLITQNGNYGFYQDQQMNSNLEQTQGFSQNQSIDAQNNNNGFQQRQLASTTIGSHFRNSSSQQNGTTYDKTQTKNQQRYSFKTYQNSESPSKGINKINGNTMTLQTTSKSVYEAEPNKSQRTYLNVNKGNINSHQNSSKDQRTSAMVVPTLQTHTNIGSQLKTQPNAGISLINQQNNANSSKGVQIISSQKSSSSLEKINPTYPTQPSKSLQTTGQNGAIGQPISNFPSSSNGLGQVSQQNKITNPRSQSMDEFSKGSIDAKQGSQQNYIQNSYLKQKTSQQVQTSEIINNLMKSFKLH